MTSAPPTSQPVKLLADSHARLEWARTALERAGDDADALRDLAAVLVSLELVARRQRATPTASSATDESAADTSRGPTHVRGSATDDNGPASGSLVPNTSRPDPSEPGALRRGLIETADQHTWSQYMQEMYCNHSVAEGRPPLPLSEPLATDLQKILAPNPPADLSDELLRKLVARLDTPPSLDSFSSSSPFYPESLPLETLRAITASLSAARGSGTRPRQRQQQAHRQAVATVLDHYLSTRCSDVDSRDAALLDAVWPIEGGESHDGAATTMGTEQQQEATAPRTSAETTEPASDEDNDDDDDEADTRSLATGIREAHESIARKDEKLTWLLGDGFRGGNVVPPPPTSSASAAGLVPAAMPRNVKTKRTAAPIVMPLPLSASGSSSSMFSARSDTATTTTHHGDPTLLRSSQVPHPHFHLHRRQGSNSSSFVTPLLRHRRSASTTGTGRISGPVTVAAPTDADVGAAEAEACPRLERQRSLSVGEGTHLLTMAAAAAGGGVGGGETGTLSGPPMLGPVVVVGPRRSPRTDKPFADLAPATAAAGGVDTPTSSSSTSNTTPPLLLDRNTLTNSERRELVRRSKKLEGFFGAPFQEATAQRVLVDGRLAPPLPLPPPRFSEPDDSEGGDRQPPEEPREEPPTTNKSEKLVIDTAAATAATATSSKAPDSAASSTVSPLSSPRRPTFSPPRRESLAAPRMHRSSSSPSRRSASFSSLASADHTYYSEQSRWRFPLPLEDEQRQREREERRKKLEKVRRFLGERVPVEVVIPCHEPPGAATERAPREAAFRSGHVKSASDHWRRGKRLISGKRPAPTTAGADFLAPPTGPGGGPIPVQNAEEWPYIEPNWQPDEAQLRAAEANHHNDAVDALSKARKLENLFGQLPPSSLYLGPEFGRPRPPPTLQHRHSSSDLASAYSPFAHGATVGGWVPASDSFGRSASSASSGRGGAADTYRRSIASLSYVAERDPDAMDEVVRVYAAGPRDEPVPEADETADEDDDDDEGPTPEAALMTRSVSAQSVRALRQAQKLSQVLGTTKGAVWGMLLRDLQEAIMDDETLDEEERGDVLRSLDKLRRTAVAA